MLVAADVVPLGAEPVDDEIVTVNGQPVAVPAGTFELDEPHTVLRFRGPVAAAWRAALTSAGVSVFAWCPPFGALVGLPAGLDAAWVRAEWPFVAGATAYRVDHCTRPPPADPGLPAPDDIVDVVVFERADRARVEADLAALGAAVLDAGTTKLRIRWPGPLDAIRDIIGVKLADRARGPAITASLLADALGASGGHDGWPDDLDGAGQVLNIADTGLDVGDPAAVHQDLAGRIRVLRSWPANASWDQVATTAGIDDGPSDRGSGHGTGMAGLAVGTGARSNGVHRGVAPACELVFQALEQRMVVRPEFQTTLPTGFYLAGRPLDLRDLWRQGEAQGARVHLASWGDPVGGAYTDDCFETDLFLADATDHVVVLAAGNEANDRDADRRPDAGGLHAPATCKNGIAVGATEGPARGVGFRGTWEDLAGSRTRFRHRADRVDRVSGEADRIALLSATGPTVDGRTKPDVCAPGTNVATTRSRATASSGWGFASPMPHYQYLGGTSVAAALVAGAVVLLRQAWTAHRGTAPSGPALKALLVLGARPVLARGSDAPEDRRVAGHGRVWVEDALPGRVELLDAVGEPLDTGERRKVDVQVSEGSTLRAVLCWYDAAGECLVDDLDLWLVHPDGTRTPAGGGAPDRRNPLEDLLVHDLPAGRYGLEVRAFNVPAGPRGFALAWRGGAPADAQPRPTVDLGVLGLRPMPGIDTLADLLDLSDAAVPSLPPAVHAVRALLDLVRPLDVPRGVPLSTPVVDVLEGPAPAGVDAVGWARLRHRLAPLWLTIDHGRRGELHLDHLIP